MLLSTIYNSTTVGGALSLLSRSVASDTALSQMVTWVKTRA
jgi:hypothetical protein